jgi:hypothetical protein
LGVGIILETTVKDEALYYDMEDVIGNAIRKFQDENVSEKPIPDVTENEEKIETEKSSIIKDISSLFTKLTSAKTTEEDTDLEDELEAEDDESIDVPVITYGFVNEQLIAENAYGASSINYNELWYGEDTTTGGLFQNDVEYVTSTMVEEMDSDMLTTEEAYEVFTEIQYAAIMGGKHENQRERYKFDMWIKFNRGLFKMFEMTALKQDVDYAPLR